MNIYFTSDLHFGHKNIIRFDNRPFTSVEEMDETLIFNWNKKVNNDDLVYILGDISWYNDEKTCEIFDRLNGRKVLIKGNHDRVHGRIKNYFEEITDYKEIVLPGNKHIVLCHYPIVFFNKHHYGAFMFYGHVHNSHEWQMTENYKFELEQLGIKCNMFNVGTMIHGYEPVNFEEITGGKYKGVSNEKISKHKEDIGHYPH